MDNSQNNQPNNPPQQTTYQMLHESQFPNGIITPQMLAATPVIAKGDIYTTDVNGIFSRLPVGSVGQVLTSVSGAPVWAAPATQTPGAGTITNTMLAPVWADFTTTPGGFSANPSPSTIRWIQLGKIAYVNFTATANGTSNATNLTYTLPVNAAQTQSIHCCGRAVDNGAIQTTAPMVKLTSGSNIATFFKDLSESAWTNSGLKSINFQFFYEVA